MLDYAIKLTLEPSTLAHRDVDALREHGFTDRAVLDLCQVAAYFNFVNRLADGLGVEMEDEWAEEDLILTRAEFAALRAEETQQGL